MPCSARIAPPNSAFGFRRLHAHTVGILSSGVAGNQRGSVCHLVQYALLTEFKQAKAQIPQTGDVRLRAGAGGGLLRAWLVLSIAWITYCAWNSDIACLLDR